MATSIDERLQRAVSDLKSDLAGVPIPDPPPRPRRLGWLLAPIAAAGLVVVGLVVIPEPLLPPDGTAAPGGVATTLPSVTVPTTTPTTITSTTPAGPVTEPAIDIPIEGPVFGEETGVILLLDDGLEGVTAVDLDGRRGGRSIVEGQRAGDEEYSMVRVGDKLVVGWSEPHAVDIATREAVSLGTATIFVPAAEPGRVWMVDSGSRIGSASVRVWQVDVITGEALHDPIPLDTDGYPHIGIEGGLVLQTDSTLNLWMSASRETVPLASTSSGSVQDVSGNHLAWCSEDCPILSVTNTGSLDTQEYQPPDGYDQFAHESQFSPNGRYLAALVRQARPPGATAIWILDRETNQTNVVSDPGTSVSFLTWTPDSSQVFATSYSYGSDRTVVWRYPIADQEFDSVVLPFGGGITPVAVDRSVGGLYLDTDLVDIASCRIPRSRVSSVTSCTFEY
ncbi:MAG: hypothetical protein ACRDZM_02890 [Acidimicrobiia bacterium]